MKKGRALWLWLLVAMVVSATFTWLLLPKEPRYEGRSLSAWLEDLSGPPWAKMGRTALRLPPVSQISVPAGSRIVTFSSVVFTLSAEQQARCDKAIEALRAIGSNALPYLLEQMNTQDSALRKKLMGLASRQSILPIYFRDAHERRAQAIQGICAVGKPAMPILEQFLNEKEMAFEAAHGLARIGPDALHPLLRALTNDSKRVRDVAVAGISGMQSEAPRIVPAMMERLCDNDPVQRKNAAIILGNLGSDAKPAVRLLLKMLNDEEVNARHAASNALRQFESKTPEKAGFR